MERLRAVFDTPKDCSDAVLRSEVYTAKGKFLEAMEQQGWVLKTPLDCFMDIGHSRNDPLKNHYVIVGFFSPLNKRPMEEGEQTIELPQHIVDKLVAKFGNMVKILN